MTETKKFLKQKGLWHLKLFFALNTTTMQRISLQNCLGHCAVQCAAKMTTETKKCLKRKRLSHVSKLSRISSPLHHWLARPNQVLSCQNNKTESEIKIFENPKKLSNCWRYFIVILVFESAKALACKAKSSLVLSK